MNTGEEQIRTVVAQQAGEWFIANQAGPLDQAGRTTFVAWLKASPIHVEEYLGVAVVARDLRLAADDPAVSLESLLEQARADKEQNVTWLAPSTPTTRRYPDQAWPSRRWSVAAAAACVTLVVAASVLWWAHDGDLLGLPRSYETGHGEQSVRQLPDGSTLFMNTDSAVTVRYSDRQRLVELHRGQALFDAAHDAAQPFRVAAGLVQATAIGTRFDVYRKADSTVVTVAEGKVAVGVLPAGGQADDGRGPRAVQSVGAGFQLRIDAGPVPDQPVAVDLNRSLAWLQHRIVFDHEPLGNVADEFNRYGQIRFEIDDAGLRALPITGVFDAYDTESFARFLSTLDGVVVERSATRIRVRLVEPSPPVPPAG